ncbi:hypothetical protein R3P38DRAFT_2808278 [Favolaschia claudopus]|uniref:Uncharacterized protein n=1 Tax=Favolaschia claudopus TaxID=2862362 RepID=A0AAV9YYK1_9AGAR
MRRDSSLHVWCRKIWVFVLILPGQPESLFKEVQPNLVRNMTDWARSLLGITDAEISQADRTGRRRENLIPLIRSWDATSRILAKFCVSAQHREHHFSGGLEVSFHEILAQLGWGETYFSKKTSSSVCGQLIEYLLYEFWNTICFVWGPGGPAQTGIIPSKHSSNQREVAAGKLTQDIVGRKARNLNVLAKSKFPSPAPLPASI